jgi:iron complex outermembrane recepter protein
MRCLPVLAAALFSSVLFSVSPCCLAESITLEEVVVQGEQEISTEESLDIRDVRETPARDIGEALDAVDGVTLLRKGAIANDIVLRGFYQDNLSVLIDGARLHGACPNRMDPAAFHIDFAEIASATVLKGPFDVRNPGSLGGMVDIKTLPTKRGLHASVTSLFGSYENINAAAKASYGTDKADALFGFSYKYALPYKDGNGDRITEIYPPTSTSRYRASEEDDKAYSINTYWTKFGYNPRDKHRMEVAYTRQEADDVIYPYLLMDAVYDDADRVNWTYTISEIVPCIEKIQVQAYWNQVEHDMTDARRVSSVGRPAGYSMRTFAESRTTGGKLSADTLVGAGRLAFGADYYLRWWDTDTTLATGTQDSIPDVDVNDVGAFLEYRYPFSQAVSLTLGGRLDHVKTEADDDRSAVYLLYHGTGDRDENDTCPSGNIQLVYAPWAQVELFAGGGVTVRPPDPVERYFALVRPMAMPNWVGNPSLDPAWNREGDIGVKYQGNWLQGKFSLYYSDVKDFITVVDVAGPKPARSYENVDATLYGGEFTFMASLPWYFFFEGGLAYTWGRDDSSDLPLLEVSPFEANVALRYDRDICFAELKGLFAAAQNRVNLDLNEESTAGWGIADFTVGGNYRKLSLVTGIQNILDKQYYRHLSYQRDPFRSGARVPEIGRSFFVTISLAL